jgi:superfamily II helicase
MITMRPTRGKTRYDDEGILYITCRDCLEEKHFTEFNIMNSNTSGRSYICRPCSSIAVDVEFECKRVLTLLGYDTSSNINGQFLQRIKDKYGIDLV